MELRPSGGDDALPDMDQAFPRRPPPPARPPPPDVLRPDEYRSEHSSCFVNCGGGGGGPAECLGCGEPCSDSFFTGSARCALCGAAFCGACRRDGLVRVGANPFACGEETGWRCADAAACETQPHALRMVRSYWGGPAGYTGVDDAADEGEAEGPMVTL